MIRPDVDDMIAFLNSLVAIDRAAIQELMSVRVPCGNELADHPSVQVATCTDDKIVGSAFMRVGESRVGILGLLNGYFGTIDEGPRKGWGPISAHYDNGFLVRFDRTKETAPDRTRPFVILRMETAARRRAAATVLGCL